MRFLEKAWYEQAWWLIVLWPLASLFRALVGVRRSVQQVLSRPEFISAPIIVVGNITLGGTGKTPLLIELSQHLKAQGIKPGVISRGYGGNAARYPMLVDEDTNPEIAGDESVLIAQRCACPIVVDPDRNAALKHLLESEQVDVVLSDDGLQHYKLYRDIEIAVVDGQRLFGNRLCLPAGPLREPIERLNSVDYIVINSNKNISHINNAIHMEMEPKFLINLVSDEKRPFNGAPFNMGTTLQAVCGIGNPERFYRALERLPYPIQRFSFPDHHKFAPNEFKKAGVDEHQPIIMTEKDAIKCADFAKSNFWFLESEINLPEEFLNEFTKKVKEIINMKN